MPQSRCSPESSWTGLYLGDCAQHLNRNDSAYVVSGIVTFWGAKYKNPPTVIFDGGGPYAQGAVASPLMSDGTSGFVTGLRILAGGWHYIGNPIFLCSGEFAVDGEHRSCPTWDEPTCMASGYALITGGHQYFENVTLVKLPVERNPKVTSSNPYTRRIDQTTCGIPDCNGVYECGPWTVDNLITCSVIPYGGQITPPRKGVPRLPHNEGIIKVPNDLLWNCYKPTTGVVDFAHCNKLGFKSVQAKKVFHGALGFGLTGDKPLDVVDTRPTPLLANPLGTRYLDIATTVTCQFSQTVQNPGCGVDSQNIQGDFTYSTTCEVNRYAGTKSITNCVENWTWSVNGDTTYPWGQYAGYYFSSPPSIDKLKLNIFTSSENGALFFVDGAGLGEDAFGHSTSQLGPSDYIARMEDNGGDAGITRTTTVTLTRTTLIIDFREVGSRDLNCPDKPTIANWDSHVKLETHYTNPYTSADIISDVTGLLAQIPLNDDILYPWRFDQYMTVAPQVGYSEMPQGVEPAPTNDCNLFNDGNTGIVNGAIIGTMLPGGYDSFFDFGHETWQSCLDPVSSSYVVVAYGWGAYANTTPGVGGTTIDPTDTVVPKNTTRWTDQIEATGYFPGAWITYDIDKRVVIAQKWAECLIRRPSINYARPCGKDRFSPDEKTAVCILSQDENAKTVTINTTDDGNPSAIRTSVPLFVCGTNTSLDGLWSGTTSDNITYNLTHLIISGQYIPNFGEYGCGQGRFGNILWPNAPAICSVLNITGATSGTPTILDISGNSYLYDGDQISIASVTGFAGINGPWTALVSGNRQQVILSGSSLNGIYSGGGTIISPTSADPYWDDFRPKGNFTTREYNYDFREVSLTPSIRQNLLTWGISNAVTDGTFVQDCLPFNICTPAVVCISPNTGELFTNGKTYPFNVGLTIDETYGTRWQKIVVQSLVDPFWERPSHSCYFDTNTSTNKRWEASKIFNQDDGSCIADDIGGSPPFMVYPHAPMIEAIDTTPTGIPPLQTGSIGCKPISYLIANANPNSYASSQFNICIPPEAVGQQPLAPPFALPNRSVIDINTYLNQLECVCGGGRFTGSYIDNGVTCSGNQIVSPP